MKENERQRFRPYQKSPTRPQTRFPKGDHRSVPVLGVRYEGVVGHKLSSIETGVT